MKYILFLIGIILIFFYQTVLFGKLPVGSDALIGLYHPWRDYYVKQYPRGMPYKNFLITDPVRQQIPWRKAAIDQWKNGNIPLWNRYAFSGTSLAGNIQAAVFYPFNILFFLFSFPVAWTILIMLQPILGGLFLYFFLRNHSHSPIASLFGAIAWIFSGFSIAWITWGTMMQTAIWTPLALIGIDNVIRKKQRWWLVVALAFSMQVFAGHAQIAMYCIVFSIFYWVSRTRRFVDILKTITVFMILSAVQWIPFLKSVISSSRAENTAWNNPGFFFPWKHLVQFIAPDYFGNPATLNYWGVWNWTELVGYIGITPLIFVFLALLSSWNRARYWTFALIVSFGFMLSSPIARLPYILHIPVISSLQPTRLMVIVDLCLAILVAIGVDAFIKKHRSAKFACVITGVIIFIVWIFAMQNGDNLIIARRNLILPSVIYIGAAVLLFAGRRWIQFRAWSLFFLIILTSFDLLRFGWKVTPFTEKKDFFPETAIMYYLLNIQKPVRVLSLEDKIAPPNAFTYTGLETAEGYDPIYSARYEQFIAVVARGKPDINPPYGFNRIITMKNIDSAFLPYLGVNYILSLEKLERPFLTWVFQEGETNVYRNDRALPRVYIADDIVVTKTPQEILNKLFESNGSHVAVIETPLPLLSLPVTPSENVSIVSYLSDRMKLNVRTENPRFIVVLNQYDTSWQVRIDGVNTPLYRANYAFSGFVVPAGSHKVDLYYNYTLW